MIDKNMAERSLALTQFARGFVPENFAIQPETGFFVLSNAESSMREGSTRFLGFVGMGTGYSGLRAGNQPDEFLPLTRLDEIQEHFRTINLQGKGVGPRVWNLPQGALGMPELPKEIAAVIFNIRRDELLDGRNGRLLDPIEVVKQISKHMAVRTGSKTVEEVVEDVHRSYGKAGAVLRSIPPQARHRMQERCIGRVGRPSFALIRHADIPLRRVGHVPIAPLTMSRR